MPKPYLPRPLRLAGRYVLTQRALCASLAIGALLGFAGLVWPGGPTADSLRTLAGMLALFCVPAAVLVGWNLLAAHAICRDAVEISVGIRARTEHAPNGIPSGKTTLSFFLPTVSGTRVVAGERSVSWHHERGSAFHTDPRGDSMLVLVSPHTGSRFIAPRADLYPLELDDEREDDIHEKRL